MQLNSLTCTWGLSDLTLIEINRSYGPQLRFTFTWIVELEDGRQIAQSTEGFRYLKKPNGDYTVEAPIRRSSTYTTYYSTMISVDLSSLIAEKLDEDGWKEKVGKNYKIERIKELPIEI